MNWYKLLKLAFNRTKSQNLTMSLSRQIFSIIKNNIGKDLATTLTADDQCDLFLQINYVGDVDLFNKNFYIEAYGNYSENRLFPPSIQFNISFNKSFSALDFPKLYQNLHNAVRHELAHYWQYLDPNYIMVDNSPVHNDDLMVRYRELRDYILSEQEIVPYIRGLVFSAQKQRKPLGVMLDENLKELFFENKESTKQDVLSSAMGKDVERMVEDIRNQVSSRAKQIYPDTRLL